MGLIQYMFLIFRYMQLSSLAALKDWVACTDIRHFEILLCIGNKVDLLPGHPVHAEYRRRLLRLGDDSADPYDEFTGYGISESEGSSLLGDEEPSWEIRRSCLEWCTQHNIEFIEACASNADFDKCKHILCLELQLASWFAIILISDVSLRMLQLQFIYIHN
jgi:hypothetical protein